MNTLNSKFKINYIESWLNESGISEYSCSSVSFWMTSINAKIYAFANDKTCVCRTSDPMIMCKSIANSISCAPFNGLKHEFSLFQFFFFFIRFILMESSSTLKYDVVKCILLERQTVEVISFLVGKRILFTDRWDDSPRANGNTEMGMMDGW